MRAARAQKDVDKADKRETDAVRKAKDEAAAAEAQRTGKEERERLQNKPYDPEPPQTTVGTKRKEPKPQTERGAAEGALPRAGEGAPHDAEIESAERATSVLDQAELTLERVEGRTLCANATDSERAVHDTAVQVAEASMQVAFDTSTFADDAWGVAKEAALKEFILHLELVPVATRE